MMQQQYHIFRCNNSFVEVGALVTKRSTDFNLMQKEAPSDGVITGYGVISDSLVYVYSQDAKVLNFKTVSSSFPTKSATPDCAINDAAAVSHFPV